MFISEDTPNRCVKCGRTQILIMPIKPSAQFLASIGIPGIPTDLSEQVMFDSFARSRFGGDPPVVVTYFCSSCRETMVTAENIRKVRKAYQDLEDEDDEDEDDESDDDIHERPEDDIEGFQPRTDYAKDFGEDDEEEDK